MKRFLTLFSIALFFCSFSALATTPQRVYISNKRSDTSGLTATGSAIAGLSLKSLTVSGDGKNETKSVSTGNIEIASKKFVGYVVLDGKQNASNGFILDVTGDKSKHCKVAIKKESKNITLEKMSCSPEIEVEAFYNPGAYTIYFSMR